jgi:hypothetical protein
MSTPERYEDTTNPKNPPNSVLRPQVRSAALSWYLGSIVGMFVLVGVALIFWMAAHPTPTSDARQQDTVGTSGYHLDGGHDPVPRPRTTRDELRFKGF